jgi:hypothetical protein
VHGRKRLVVRQDRYVGEHDVAGGVIEMAMRIDQHIDALAGFCFDRGAKFLRQPWILLGIDGDEAVRGSRRRQRWNHRPRRSRHGRPRPRSGAAVP